MGLRLLIGYESALSFWRNMRASQPRGGWDGGDEGGRVFGMRLRTLRERSREALRICGQEGRLDLVVPPGETRHNCDLVRDHRWAGPCDDGVLFQVDSLTYVYRMPAVLVQLAASWDEVELAKVAMEMMGTYGMSEVSDMGWDRDIAPLVSHGELRDFARRSAAVGVRGAARAARAVELSVPNSNSPRETAVAIYLRLPRRSGGAELGGFVMNKGIRLGEEQQRIAGQEVVRPDFTWEGPKVSVEYDSDYAHLNSTRKTKDERRRNALESMGYRMPSLTNGIVKDVDALCAFTRELERSLGLRRRPLSVREEGRRRDLCARLFGRSF